MLLLLPIPFVELGCLAFLLAALIPPARRLSLGLSLWFASFGVFLTAIVGAIILAFVGADYAKNAVLPLGARGMGAGSWGSFASKQIMLIGCVVILLAAILATGLSMLQGVLVRRITF